MGELTFTYRLTSQSVLAYARALDMPLSSHSGRWIAPPTMPVVFWNIIDAPWLRPDNSYLHGRQSFVYAKPLLADSTLDCVLILTHSEQKKGRSGPLTLYTHLMTCKCEGEHILSAETVLIHLNN
ncbi:hypothetical protein B9G55_05080 [Saccharibacillus sp. O16]|nr:hypothetical protein B9G55_05080 [Saccharibacillus sp. O16]